MDTNLFSISSLIALVEIVVSTGLSYLLFCWLVSQGKITPKKDLPLWLGISLVTVLIFIMIIVSVASYGPIGGFPLVLVLGLTSFEAYYYNPFYKKV